MKKVLFLALLILILNVSICSADLLEQNLFLLSNDYFEEIRNFGDAYMVKDLEQHYWYLLDKNGDIVSNTNYDEVLNYDGSYIAVGKKLSSGKIAYGVIDYTGKEIVPLKYKENIQILKIHNYIKVENFDGKCFLYSKNSNTVKEIPYGEIVESPSSIIIYNKDTVEDKTINQGIRMNLFGYDKNMNFVFDYSDSINYVDSENYRDDYVDLLITGRLTNFGDLKGVINTQNGHVIPAENDSIHVVDNYIIVRKLKPEKSDPSTWDVSIFGVRMYNKDYTCKIYDYSLTEQNKLYKDFELVNVLYNEYSKKMYLLSYDKKTDEYGIRDIDGNLLHLTKQEPYWLSKNVLETNWSADKGYIYIGDDKTAHEGTIDEEIFDKFTLLYYTMNDEKILVQARDGYGIFDAKNKEYIVPKNIYSQIIPRTSEYALAQKDDKWNIINYKGEIILPLENIEIHSYSSTPNRYFKVKKGNYKNIFDIEKLDFIFDWKYKEILEYENYYSAKTEDGYIDLINFNNEILLNTKADLAWYYNDTIDILNDGKRQIYKIGGGEPSNWATYGVGQMNSLGLTPNNLKGLYQKNITRSEFCDIIANIIYEKKNLSTDEIMSIINKAEKFIDSDSQNVSFCNSVGIVNGRGKKVFAPNDNITREEAAVIINNTLKYLDINETSDENKINLVDYDNISNWAKDAVNSVVNNRLIVGVDGNRYDPQGKLSREQAIVICYRLMRK